MLNSQSREFHKYFWANNCTHTTIIWSKIWKIPSSDAKSVYFCKFLPCCAVSHFRRETANENKQSKETKTSNSHLMSHSFQGYRCKSGIVIFVRRVIWNDVYSSFSLKNCFCLFISHHVPLDNFITVWWVYDESITLLDLPNIKLI